MKSLVRVLAVAVVVAGLAAAGASASAADTDLSWVAKLPGLSGGVQNRVGNEIKIVYTFTDDTDRTMDLLYAGLEQRGWRVERNASVSVAGVSAIEGAQARKGTARLNIAIMGTAGARTLALRLLGGTTAAPAAGGRAASGGREGAGAVIREEGVGSVALGADGSLVVRDESGDTVSVAGGKIRARDSSGQSVTIDAGGVVGESHGGGRAIVVNGSDVTRTVRCEGGEVVSVSGNDNQVTLKGKCGVLNVSGNDNNATVLGSIDKIFVSGNDNSVGWDPAANPHAPAIAKSGNDNRVYRMGE